MLILLSCAKTMTAVSKTKVPFCTTPLFQLNATEIALQMTQYSVEELEALLRVNGKIALENYKRYRVFHDHEETALPAILAYTGIVFKRLDPAGFNPDDFAYAQKALRFTSFCYGLLRPLDQIKNYRLEGDVKLPVAADHTLFSYWKDLLTDLFIEEIRQNGGTLAYLASDEMRGLFHWDKVLSAVKVITPEFHIWKGGKLSTVVVYTKMARGEMARYIIKNRMTDPETLKAFSWEGFEYNVSLSDDKKLVFTLGVG